MVRNVLNKKLFVIGLGLTGKAVINNVIYNNQIKKSFSTSSSFKMPNENKDFKDRKYSLYTTEELGGKAREEIESCEKRKEAEKVCDNIHKELVSENSKLIQEVQSDTNKEISRVQQSNLSSEEKQSRIDHIQSELANNVQDFNELLVERLKIVNESLDALFPEDDSEDDDDESGNNTGGSVGGGTGTIISDSNTTASYSLIDEYADLNSEMPDYI